MHKDSYNFCSTFFSKGHLVGIKESGSYDQKTRGVTREMCLEVLMFPRTVHEKGHDLILIYAFRVHRAPHSFNFIWESSWNIKEKY